MDFVVLSSAPRLYVLDTERGAELSTDHTVGGELDPIEREAFVQTWEYLKANWEHLEDPVCQVFNSHLWKNFSLTPGEDRDM